MRSVLIFSIFVAGIFVGGQSFGQTTVPVIPEKPGVILVRVSSLLDSAMSAVFYSTRPTNDPTFAHSEIDLAVLSNDSSIRQLLGLPNALHGLQLKPFIPTHSVAFQDIRERSNPQLFAIEDVVQSANPTENVTTDLTALRTSENNISHWFMLFYSDSISGDRASELARKSTFIQIAEPQYIRETFYTPYTPNDPDVSQQYSLSVMNVFLAWDVVRCDSTMIVADADIGTDWTHQDLAASIYQNPGEIGIDKNGNDKRYNGIDDDSDGFIDDWHGWDFGGTYGTTPDNNPEPGLGTDGEVVMHGTQTAGIFAATGNNDNGMAGVAFGAKIIPIKISDDAGDIDFPFEGILYAADMHARIVNCSWGGTGRSDAEQDVVNYAYAKGCAVIAAAGNSGNTNPFQDIYPAAYDHVLSVAALDQNSNIASFSNFNTHVDVSAPGYGIFSTIPTLGSTIDNSYISDPNYASGTSFAAPNAAGVVALVLQEFPNFTVGQAMQQVRVTSDPVEAVWDNNTGIVTPVDTTRIDYEGYGAVDAFQAVTDTNTFSARIDSITLDDANGTGTFTPGESGDIVIHAMNYLKPLQQLNARVEIVNGANYVTLHQTVIPFGSAATLQEVSNNAETFEITVADSVPINTQILVRVFFYDSIVGYVQDYDYFSFVVQPAYLDLNANNLTVTFSSIGSLGYNDVLNNEEGSGFLWRTAPDSISPFGRTLLYEGGLMVGTDTNHVVDVVIGTDGETADEDLTPSQITHYVQPPDHANAAQELAFALTDTLADSSIKIGLYATCQAYAFTQGLAANALVAKYVFRGMPGSKLALTDSAAAALFLDWDIGLSGADNITEFDSASATAISYRTDPDYPYLGMKLLSPLPSGAALNYYAIMNDGSQGPIDIYQSYSKANKWTTMTDFNSSAGPGDISHTFGLKNMPMRSQDSVVMTVVIALAENTALLQQTLGEVYTLWFGADAVTPETLAPSNTLEVFPNPFHNTLHVAWDMSGPARVTIYDALGRAIVSQEVMSSQFDFSPPEIPSGFYTIDVEVNGTHLRRHVVASN